METKAQRIFNTVQGKHVEKQAFTFWTHLPAYDLDPTKLALATYDFYRKYNIDLIKTMDNGMYPIEDYGCRIDYSEIVYGGAAKLVYTPIGKSADLSKIRRLKIEDTFALKRELVSLKQLVDLTKGEQVPILFTVFSPLTTLNKLTDGKAIHYIAKGLGTQVHHALGAICETTIDLVTEALQFGASGIFLASQMSRYEICSEEIYREYGRYYDVKILESVSPGYLRALHAHGTGIMYDLLKDYPCEIFNWHVGETEPDLKTAALSGKCLMAGLVRTDVTHSDLPALKKQICDSIDLFHGYKQIIAPGCVIRYPVEEETLHFIKRTIDEYYARSMTE